MSKNTMTTLETVKQTLIDTKNAMMRAYAKVMAMPCDKKHTGEYFRAVNEYRDLEAQVKVMEGSFYSTWIK